jgi:hypothetical protein
MNSSVILMKKNENIGKLLTTTHSTIRHHMINKITYAIYWKPLTLQVPTSKSVIKFCETQH